MVIFVGFFAACLLCGCGLDARKLTNSETSDAGEGGAAGEGAVVESRNEGSLAANPWALWPMPNPPGLGLPNNREYGREEIESGSMVTDRVTELVWQADTTESRYSWSEAHDHCEVLELGQFDDWRLPSRLELVSIVDYSEFGPAIDEEVFSSFDPGDYWTASPLVGTMNSRAWSVRFEMGATLGESTESRLSVRCVRSGATPASIPRNSGDLYDVDSQTAHDRFTGLTWQRLPDGSACGRGTCSWEGALRYCEDLDLGGISDWRLPSVGELQTITDEATRLPAVNSAAFPSTRTGSYWSSTIYGDSGSVIAWTVDFAEGSTSPQGMNVDSIVAVRCVY